jgi:hypothetical protein
MRGRATLIPNQIPTDKGKTMKNSIAQTTEQELLRRAQFHPVFDQDGNLCGISQLEIETDRRLGAQAMRDLNQTQVGGDDVTDMDGWTGKQRRIIATPAPNACHYLKASRKWDAANNDFKPSFTILLPYEVTWTLFELLFQGQYSIEVEDLTSDNEEIMPASAEYMGRKPDNAPGRMIYARATVKVKIHLKNGQTRAYDGVGVAYGDVPMDKIGNIFAINNARRTAEKGAISDARREALSSVGQVFRRAFEDGDEMIKTLEEMLLEELRIRNKPAIQTSRSTAAAPAPRAKKTKQTDQSPAPAKLKSAEKAPEKEDIQDKSETSNSQGTVYLEVGDEEYIPVPTGSFDDELVEVLFSRAATKAQFESIIARNKNVIDDNLKNKTIIIELLNNFEAEEDGIPDFEESGSGDVVDETPSKTKDALDTDDNVETSALNASVINPDGLSGKKVLEKYIALFEGAKTDADLNAIIDANKIAARKLTPKQLGAMGEAKSKRKDKISK